MGLRYKSVEKQSQNLFLYQKETTPQIHAQQDFIAFKTEKGEAILKDF